MNYMSIQTKHQVDVLKEIMKANEWVKEHRGPSWEIKDYAEFLSKITPNDKEIIMTLLSVNELMTRQHLLKDLEYTKDDAEDAACEEALERARGII
jgi:hypothetical protein